MSWAGREQVYPMKSVTQAAPLPESLWDDDIWEALLASIAKERVIPIVGPALSVVEVDGHPLTIDRYVAGQLAKKLSFPGGELPEQPTLDDVVSRHLRLHGRDALNDLYRKIFGILRDATFAPPKALVQLAEITHFKLFVTTAFDSLLESAINQVRFAGVKRTQSISYIPNEMPDCDIKIGQRKLPTPTIYHLLGKVSPAPDYVISEEDLLEYICALQSDRRPVNLFDELKSSHLLILGGNFSDWLARLFLRIAKRQRLSDPRDPRDALEILADERMRADATLVSFLSNFSRPTKMFGANANEFVDELWQRWKERFGSAASAETKPAEEMPAGAIFISYAHEDIDAVQNLTAGLHAQGLPVWFDKDRLGGGDSYDDKIKNNIKKCALFIPVLSRNTERRVTNAYFRREWHLAVDRDTFNARNVRFIVPVTVDSAVDSFTNVPERFLELHVESLPGGDVTPRFAALLKSSIQDRA